MKINYKVLWIEDHFYAVEPFIEGLENRLENYGFKFEIERKTTLNDDELIELDRRLLTHNPYDMIFVDYDLGEKTGDDIASQLRRTIFTDMIFYSGKPLRELRQILCNKEVDGVYIINRNDFIVESWLIIEDQIKRIFDVNNMRGVLLDEMSKIDLEIRNLCSKKYGDLSVEDQERQLMKFKEKLDENKKLIAKQIENINVESFSETIKNPTQMKFNTVRSRLKSMTGDDKLFGENSELKLKQDLRNEFAHNMAEYDDETGTISLSGSDKTMYGFGEFTQIRKELIDLSNEMKDV